MTLAYRLTRTAIYAQKHVLYLTLKTHATTKGCATRRERRKSIHTLNKAFNLTSPPFVVNKLLTLKILSNHEGHKEKRRKPLKVNASF